MSVLQTIIATRNAEADVLESWLKTILDEKRNLTPEEEVTFAEKRGLVSKLDERISELTLQERARAESDKTLKDLGLGTIDIRVKHEPRVYDKGLGHSYFRDLWGERQGNIGAHDRLIRHAREVEVVAREDSNSIEFRALSTSDGAGGYFVPPAWLVNKYIKFAREGRPFANRTNRGIFNSKAIKQQSSLFGARGMTITHIPKALILTTRLSLFDRVKKQSLRRFEREDVALIWPRSYEIQLMPTHPPQAGSSSLRRGVLPSAKAGAVSTSQLR